MNDSEDRPDLVDTLLRERAGADAEPDLTESVLARLQRGEGAVQAGRLRWERATSPRRAHAWLAAAVLLLGLGVVAAVAFTRREQEAAAVEPSAPEPNPQDPVRQAPEPTPPATGTRLLFVLDVIDPLGGPVSNYEFELLRVWSREPAAYNRVATFAVTPGDAPSRASSGPGKFHVRSTGVYPFDRAIEGDLADGDYVVVVTDEMHARTTSEPFAVAKGTLPKVKVRMSAGVAFELHVATIPGKPIADVLVTTRRSLATRRVVRQDEMLLDLGDLGPALSVPNLLSTLRATSTASGAVSFRRVTPGTYRLVFEHPDYCTTVLDPVEVPLAAPLEPVRMIPGAVVRGTVKGSAEAIAGAKLTLSPKDGTTPSAGLWPMVTHANAKGEFAFDSHVPPGAYRMTPLREPSTAHVLSNAQGVVRDSVEFEVEEGQTEVQIDPRIHGN